MSITDEALKQMREHAERHQKGGITNVTAMSYDVVSLVGEVETLRTLLVEALDEWERTLLVEALDEWERWETESRNRNRADERIQAIRTEAGLPEPEPESYCLDCGAPHPHHCPGRPGEDDEA